MMREQSRKTEKHSSFEAVPFVEDIMNKNIGDDKIGGLHTPCQEVTKSSKRNVAILSVGGERFETYHSTLRNDPSCVLADGNFLQKHFRAENGDYFFDRDPEMFKYILNYLRTGKLHIPSYMCGPSAKYELDYWGISDFRIEKCCWTSYASWNSNRKALENLERDQKITFYQSAMVDGEISTCNRYRQTIWNILSNKSWSRASKIYGWMSLIFICLSIFLLCAETHSTFQIPGKKDLLGRSARSLNLTIGKMDLKHVGKESCAQNNGTKQLNCSETEFADLKVPHPALVVFTLICTAFFATEYALRLFTSPKALRYVISAFGVIDLLALVSDFVEIFVEPFIDPDNTFVAFVPMLRIMRIFRIMRLMRHFPSLWLFFYTLKASVRELFVLTIFLLAGILIFSTLIYFADDRKTFTSIPHSFWWAVITMTTVGYGDMYPTTMWGYCVGSMAALSGLLMIGFSVPVLVNNFILYYTHIQYVLEHESIQASRDSSESGERKNSTPLYPSEGGLQRSRTFKLVAIKKEQPDIETPC